MAAAPFGDRGVLLGHAMEALQDAFDVYPSFEVAPGMLEMVSNRRDISLQFFLLEHSSCSLQSHTESGLRPWH